jgi:hypothetical protein
MQLAVHDRVLEKLMTSTATRAISRMGARTSLLPMKRGWRSALIDLEQPNMVRLLQVQASGQVHCADGTKIRH